MLYVWQQKRGWHAPCTFAKSNISTLFMRYVFVFQFRFSEVKGLHHSMSCMAYIFVTLFTVQMLVSKKWVTLMHMRATIIKFDVLIGTMSKWNPVQLFIILLGDFFMLHLSVIFKLVISHVTVSLLTYTHSSCIHGWISSVNNQFSSPSQ